MFNNLIDDSKIIYFKYYLPISYIKDNKYGKTPEDALNDSIC